MKQIKSKLYIVIDKKGDITNDDGTIYTEEELLNYDIDTYDEIYEIYEIKIGKRFIIKTTLVEASNK